MKQPPQLCLKTNQHTSDTHSQTQMEACACTHISTCFLFLFYLSIKVSDSQNPQRSLMHGFTPQLHSQQNKLKALRKSQKSEKLRETECEKKQNNLSTNYNAPLCLRHLHITNPHPQPSTAPHLERHRMKWHYAYENVQKDVWFMYALDANSITGH